LPLCTAIDVAITAVEQGCCYGKDSMSKVTSKLQVTVPKDVADEFGIRPGDEIDWIPAGDGIRVVKRAPPRRKAVADSATARLRHFDEATKRQNSRNAPVTPASPGTGRGWTREDLYRRGGTR
jgi:AbrB family looped-hinge helix DNA binding protein